MNRTLTLSILPAVIAVLLLAGCGASQAKTPWQPGDEDPFAVFNENAMSRIMFDQMRVRGECMVSKGYPGASTWIPKTWENPETMRIGYSGPLFRSMEQARMTGFGMNDPGRVEMATAKRANESPITAEARDKADTICIDQALSKAGENAQKYFDDYVYLSQDMNGKLKVAADEISKEPLDRVVQCLADQGYPATRSVNGIAGFDTTMPFGDYERPAEEPRTIMRNGFEYVAAIKPNRYVPTPKETELAGAYVECGKSTGAAADYLTALRREQQMIVAEFEGQLAELTPLIEDIAKKTTAIAGG